jgi:hypothetical protein
VRAPARAPVVGVKQSQEAFVAIHQRIRIRALLRFGLLVALLGVAVLSGAAPARAQSYSFAVPQLDMQVFVQPDASVRIVYDITFENYGSAIDVVDVGLPHRDYDISNMEASIDGVTLSDIRTSEYIDVGVEVHLDGQAIPSGQRGTLHFEATMPDMVYQDTTNAELASLQITPTWFDADAVRGGGTVRIVIHMLPTVEPDEVLYQDVEFTDKVVFEDHVVARWVWSDTSMSDPHLVGVSFPKRGMERVVRMTLLQLIEEWLQDNPDTRFLLDLLAIGLLTVLFFRFSGGTGCTVFVILVAGLGFVLFAYAPSVLLAIPALIVLIVLNERSLKNKPKRGTYMPPIAQVEGGGIKRGLTAPEAAALLEMPLNKVLTLVIFGLLEKGILKQTNADPLAVRVSEPFKTWDNATYRDSLKRRRKRRRKVAQAQGTVVHTYEDYFLDQIERHEGDPVQKIDFSMPMERLLKLTAAKMEGFDLSDTQEYYQRVIDRAMEQASQLGEIEQREQYLDKYLPWVMMDERYPTVLTHGGHHYWPIWMRPGRSVRSATRSGRSSGRSIDLSGGDRSGAPGRTSFGDVAGSFAGWTETTMGGLAAAIMPGSMNLPDPKGGLVDLSGVDRVTGDIFEALSESSGSGGGGGGGSSCACACAGCACACACAGGGR